MFGQLRLGASTAQFAVESEHIRADVISVGPSHHAAFVIHADALEEALVPQRLHQRTAPLERQALQIRLADEAVCERHTQTMPPAGRLL